MEGFWRWRWSREMPGPPPKVERPLHLPLGKHALERSPFGEPSERRWLAGKTWRAWDRYDRAGTLGCRPVVDLPCRILVGNGYPTTFFTAAMTLSTLGVTYCSSLGAKGIGVCISVTRWIGASRRSNPFSATVAATSEAKLHFG